MGPQTKFSEAERGQENIKRPDRKRDWQNHQAHHEGYADREHHRIIELMPELVDHNVRDRIEQRRAEAEGHSEHVPVGPNSVGGGKLHQRHSEVPEGADGEQDYGRQELESAR